MGTVGAVKDLLSIPTAGDTLKKANVPSDEDASDGCIPNAHRTASHGR